MNAAEVLISINNAIIAIREIQADPTTPDEIVRDLNRPLMNLYEAARQAVPLPPAEPSER